MTRQADYRSRQECNQIQPHETCAYEFSAGKRPHLRNYSASLANTSDATNAHDAKHKVAIRMAVNGLEN